MDVVLTINGRDFSNRLSKYNMQKAHEEARLITTLDGVEHSVQRTRDVVTFSLIPFSDDTAAADFAALQGEFIAHYTDTFSGTESSGYMRVTSNLDAAFGLRSIDGNRYYKGGNIVIRAVRANT